MKRSCSLGAENFTSFCLFPLMGCLDVLVGCCLDEALSGFVMLMLETIRGHPRKKGEVPHPRSTCQCLGLSWHFEFSHSLNYLRPKWLFSPSKGKNYMGRPTTGRVIGLFGHELMKVPDLRP